jgi:hydroxyacylglutathione hydrolase
MNVHFHYSIYGFSNSYLVGGDAGGDALLVDPGNIDARLLEYIEGNGYYVRGVLLTHNHNAHVHGIKTLLKIYAAVVYSSNAEVQEVSCSILHDGQSADICGFRVEVFSIPGHSSDSLAYRIGDCLFTGDALTAGRLGSTSNPYGTRLLFENIQKKLIARCSDCLVFPGHGPPSSMEAEIACNPQLRNPPVTRQRPRIIEDF